MIFLSFFSGAVISVILSFVIFYIYITKKKIKAEYHEKKLELLRLEKKREDEEFTQMMFDAAPLSCYLWDSSTKLLACNQEAIKLFGCLDKKEYLEKFENFIPKYQSNGTLSKKLMAENAAVAFKNGRSRFEFTYKTITGEDLPADVTLVRMEHRGKHILAGYIRDLREHNKILGEMRKVENDLRLARDAAEAASRAKSDFLANMSHEIRTPMNSIIGFSELALDDIVLPKTRDYLCRIHENADGLLQIINDILDISKVESGKMELEHIPFDLHEIFTLCQNAIKPRVLKKNIQVHFYCEPTGGRKLMGDPTKLRQALTNIISNAVKFTDSGSVTVNAAVKNLSKDNVTIYFEVRDTGIGLTAQQIGKLFEPFTQADSGTTRKYGGTGLGLSISKNFIALMGGQLSIESMPTVGSNFSFCLTFDTMQIPIEITVNENPAKISKPVFEGEVLVCEDNDMNQVVIKEALAKVGLKCVIAENGSIGVDLVRKRVEKGEKPFDLIFMDIQMPVMDGIEASSLINNFKTGTPLIAVTANIMPSDKEYYKSKGIPDFLGKPFTSMELWKCLLKYLMPVNTDSAENEKRQIELDVEFQKAIQILFVKNNQKKFEEIATAIDNNNIELAHRLVHTLKTNSGQIGKTRLQAAAADVEQQLKFNENHVTEKKLTILNNELKSVLKELSPLLDQNPKQDSAVKNEPLAPEKIHELFEKLEPLLKRGNPECLNLTSDLRSVPESAQIIQEIDDFEFEKALASLTAMRAALRQ